MTSFPTSQETEALDLASISARLEAALMSAAHEAAPGSTLALASINIELAEAACACEGSIARGWVERATRTLIFASAELRISADGPLTAAASAVLKIKA